MKFYHEIRLSGSGGQGMMLAGSILAEAIGIYEDKWVAQTRSYGPESRGGASRTELIVSDDSIEYPEVTQPDLVLAMTQESCDKYHQDIKPGGILIVDTGFVKTLPKSPETIYCVQITQIAKEKVGKEMSANIVALGVIAAVVDWCAKDSVEKVIHERMPKGTEKFNAMAFEAGYQAGKELLEKGGLNK